MRTTKIISAFVCVILSLTCFNALAADDIEVLLKELSGKTASSGRSARELRGVYNEALDHLVPLMAADDFEYRYDPQKLFSLIAAHAARPGAEKERQSLCEVMVKRLGKKTPQASRVWLLRQLENIGSKESVSALGKCLEDADEEVREVARRALEANPSSSANGALRAALKDAGDARWRIGLINSLGQRRDTRAVRTLVKALGDPDESVAAAAASALGNISNSTALRALFKFYENETGRTKKAVSDALLDAGTVLAGRGDKKAALRLYEKLYDQENEASIRAAALGGIASVDAQKGLDKALESFKSNQAALQTAAVQFARNAADPDLNKTMADALPGLRIALQLQVLGLLSEQGNERTQSSVIEMLDSREQAVRLAAIKALGHVANRATVNALLAAVSKGREEEKAVMQTLARLGGEDVRSALRQKAGSGDSEIRVAAIKALAARSDYDQVGRVMKYARGVDSKVAVAAIEAVGSLGGDSEIPGLVGIVLNARQKAERASAQAALSSLCRRSSDTSAVSTRIASQMASSDIDGKRAILDVLQLLGDTSGLDAVMAAAKSKNETLRDAAIRALCGWSTYGAADSLLAIASDKKQPLKYNVLAMRGIVRLLKSENSVSNATRLDHAKRALAAARSADETRLVISALPSINDTATADLLITYIDDPKTAEEATQAARELAESLKKIDREASRKLLRLVPDKE